MARGIIHNKGPKVERDRAKLVKLYDSFCRAFHIMDPMTHEELSKANNFQLNGICSHLWSVQTPGAQAAYMAHLKDHPLDVVQAPKPVRFRNLIVPADLPEAPNV